MPTRGNDLRHGTLEGDEREEKLYPRGSQTRRGRRGRGRRGSRGSQREGDEGDERGRLIPSRISNKTRERQNLKQDERENKYLFSLQTRREREHFFFLHPQPPPLALHPPTHPQTHPAAQPSPTLHTPPEPPTTTKYPRRNKLDSKIGRVPSGGPWTWGIVALGLANAVLAQHFVLGMFAVLYNGFR